MTKEETTKCHAIIHTHAAACGGANLAPIPGLGVAADLITMTTMTMALSAVFGCSITEQVAKGMAIAAIKNTMLKQPIKTATRELSKLIPFVGQLVAPSIGVAMIEAAGWQIANELDNNRSKNV